MPCHGPRTVVARACTSGVQRTRRGRSRSALRLRCTAVAGTRRLLVPGVANSPSRGRGRPLPGVASRVPRGDRRHIRRSRVRLRLPGLPADDPPSVITPQRVRTRTATYIEYQRPLPWTSILQRHTFNLRYNTLASPKPDCSLPATHTFIPHALYTVFTLLHSPRTPQHAALALARHCASATSTRRR